MVRVDNWMHDKRNKCSYMHYHGLVKYNSETFEQIFTFSKQAFNESLDFCNNFLQTRSIHDSMNIPKI